MKDVPESERMAASRSTEMKLKLKYPSTPAHFPRYALNQ